MLLQFKRLQSENHLRRREENNKFLFKRFFKFVQKRHGEPPQKSFDRFYREVLSQEFDKDALAEYFKVVRDTPLPLGENKQSLEKAYRVPCKINAEFEEKLLRIPRFREELRAYMRDHLIEQTKNELKESGLRFLYRFYLILKEIDPNALTAALSNHIFSKKCKSSWTVSEVNEIIEDMQRRIERAGQTTESSAN